jgi:hypothetical protein
MAKDDTERIASLGREIAAGGPIATLAAITHYYHRTGGAYPNAAQAGREREYLGFIPATRQAASDHIRRLVKAEKVTTVNEGPGGRMSGIAVVELLPFNLADVPLLKSIVAESALIELVPKSASRKLREKAYAKAKADAKAKANERTQRKSKAAKAVKKRKPRASLRDAT